MKKASTTGFVIAMAAVGIFVLSASFFVGRLISLENTDESFSKTIDYLREQCISYDEIINADKVKSLIRLTEKATEIAFISIKTREAILRTGLTILPSANEFPQLKS